MAKARPENVDPVRAREALALVRGDLKRAYSEYVRLTYQQTGSLVPGCDAADLMAWYDQEEKSTHDAP